MNIELLFWAEWFGYPGRESLVGNPHLNPQRSKRVFLSSPKDLEIHIEEREKLREPCYLSVQPFKERNTLYCIEKIYSDFDCKGNLDKAWTEACKFAVLLEKYYHVKPLVCFSGNKGYNVYTFLREPLPVRDQKKAKRLYEKMVEKLFKGLCFETLDPSPLKDVARLSRIPYTIHEESGNHCIPLTYDRKPLLVLTLRGFREHGLKPEFVNACLDEISNEPKLRPFHRSVSVNFRVKVRPCIEAAVNKHLENEGGHLLRLAVAVEYLNKGFSVPQVVDLFRSQTDFSEEKTRYYVEDALRKRYKPFTCSKIKDLGFCLEASCPIYKKRHRDEPLLRS